MNGLRVTMLIPGHALPTLRIPPLAITDGTADPVWVSMPCRDNGMMNRGGGLPLPYDADTAHNAQRWARAQQRRTGTLTPLFAVAITISIFGTAVTSSVDIWIPLTAQALLVAAGITAWCVAQHRERLLLPRQYPQRIRGGSIQVADVAASVGQEWHRCNPDITVREYKSNE